MRRGGRALRAGPLAVGIAATTMMAASTAAPLAQAQGLALRDLIRLAGDRSPTIDIARQQLMARDAEASSAAAAFFPSLDVSATHGVRKGSVRYPWASEYSVSLTEKLYDGGESVIQLRSARLNEDLARLELSQTQNSQALEIARNYYDYSLAFALLDVRKQQREILDRLYRTILNQYRQGLKTHQDYLRFEIQAQRAEIDVALAETDLARALNALMKSVGTVSGPIQVAALQIDPAIVLADQVVVDPLDIEHTFEFRSSLLESSIADQATKLARARYWPQFFLTSEVAYGDSDYLGPRPSSQTSTGGAFSWNALLTVRYNLWDWGTRKRSVLIAESNRLIRANEIQRELNTVRERSSNLKVNVPVLKSSFQLNRKLLKLEQDSYRLLELDYRNGKIPYIDLITGLTNLLDSRVRLFRSTYELLSNQAEMLYFKGTLYETLSNS